MKFKAFTLLEMLLVMALTGIALAIAWGAWEGFALFGRESQKRSQDHQQWLRLDRALTQDSRAAEDVLITDVGWQFQPSHGIRYEVIPEGVIRKTQGTGDTIFLPLETFQVDPSEDHKDLYLHFKTGPSLTYPVFFKVRARKPLTEQL